MFGSSYSYVRESTQKQEMSGLGREAQISRNEHHARTCVALQGHNFGGHYVDSAVSGSIRFTDRPKGAELDRIVKRGDVIIIARLDRAFRRTRDALEMVERWNDLGIALHVVDFGGNTMDMMTGMGKFILTVLVAFAELERYYISERSSLACQARKERQGSGSGSEAGVGWKWQQRGPKRVRIPDQQQLDLMKQFYDWHVTSNLSAQHIAQHMNRVLKIPNQWGKKKNVRGEWSPWTVKNWVQAEMQRRISEAEGDPIAQAELLMETEDYEPTSPGGIILASR